MWLVTARSGSKGVPDKNIKMLNGLPLLAYRIKSVLTFADPKDVWVSTDSEGYAKIAQGYGATVPFIRPAGLATDKATSVDVTLHAMNWAESNGLHYDAVGLLQPTSPFVKPESLVRALGELFSDSAVDSVVAVRELSHSNFYVQKKSRFLSTIAQKIAGRAVMRRQDIEPEITPCGGFYISKWEPFKENKTFYSNSTVGYIVSDLEGLDIDEPLDWLWCEFLLEKGLIDVSELFNKILD